MNSRIAARIARNTHKQYGLRGSVRLVRVTWEYRDVIRDPRHAR